MLSFTPYLSVIIPIYNGENDLSELAECLRKQTYPLEKIEYLLIDNNSVDRTWELLNQNFHLPIKPLQELTIQSSYSARNKGILSAQYDYLIFTDMDCRPSPQWLEELVKGFINDQVGVVAGEILGLEGKSLLENYAIKNEFLSQKHGLNHPFLPYGQTANLAIRKIVLEKVGLFRPYLTTGGDADICWRILQQTEFKLEFTPSALVYHRHRSTMTDLYKQLYRYGKSNQYLHQLHNIELARELTTQEIIYRLSRWLLKETPRNVLEIIQKKKQIGDLLDTPIDLFCYYARSQGQKKSQLSERDREILKFQPPKE